MPYQSVEADPAVEHNGTVVYHTYIDDMYNLGAMTYWFTMDPIADDEQFDVRELDAWTLETAVNPEPQGAPASAGQDAIKEGIADRAEFIRKVLRSAIETGELVEP